MHNTVLLAEELYIEYGTGTVNGGSCGSRADGDCCCVRRVNGGSRGSRADGDPGRRRRCSHHEKLQEVCLQEVLPDASVQVMLISVSSLPAFSRRWIAPTMTFWTFCACLSS